MKNFYYSIISSGLSGVKNNDPYTYKSTVLIIASVMFSLNLFSVNMWLNAFGVCDMMNLVTVDIISKKSLLSGQIHGILNYGVIALIANYFVLYYRSNYKIILKNHSKKNGKLFIYYSVATMLTMILTAVLVKWLRDKGLAEELSFMQPLWTLKLF